jgi:RNA polymerase sigma-70 factor (ECF subfamily)
MLQQHFNNSRSDAPNISDADLMSDIATGDHVAFVEIMARYKAPLYRFILRYVGASADAEDLLQDTLISVYSKASTYDPAWKASVWIYRIALNKCRDLGRKRRLRKHISLDCGRNGEDGAADVPEVADLGPDVEHIVAYRQLYDRLARAIEDLPHNLRSALVLNAIEGRSQLECAEILGISRKSVEMLVYRARKKLREHVEFSS